MVCNGIEIVFTGNCIVSGKRKIICFKEIPKEIQNSKLEGAKNLTLLRIAGKAGIVDVRNITIDFAALVLQHGHTLAACVN